MPFDTSSRAKKPPCSRVQRSPSRSNPVSAPGPKLAETEPLACCEERVPGPALALQDDRDRSAADRHQPRHAGGRAEAPPSISEASRRISTCVALGLAVEAQAGLDVAAEGRGIRDVEGRKPVVDLRGGGDVGKRDRAAVAFAADSLQIEIEAVGEVWCR